MKELLETGDYHDQNEVIAEAVLLLEDERKLRDLWAALAEGDAQAERGEYELWTPELRSEIRREAQRKVPESREPNPDVIP